MKNIRFLFLGIFFAIVLSKTEAISWFRYYEMFRFQSFHMYGIFAGAIVFSAAIMQLFKSGKIKDQFGNPIQPAIDDIIKTVPDLLNSIFFIKASKDLITPK